MKNIITTLIVIVTFSCNILFSQNVVKVSGYYRKNGSYVQPHFKTAPNQSMFDNYSTKGNFNPFTGKQGWIDPYYKISSSYRKKVSNGQEPNYEKIFYYLNRKDFNKFYDHVKNFDYEYKTFFLGIFKLNNNETKEANQIFNELKQEKIASNFIKSESDYWFKITSKYLEAEEEFNNLSNSLKKYESDGDYQSLKTELNGVKNPLNYYFKYVIQFTLNLDHHKYIYAKNDLDSLLIYASDSEMKDSLLKNYEIVVENLLYTQKYLDTRKNKTFYYSIQNLLDNFKKFSNNQETLIDNVMNGSFTLLKEKSDKNEIVFNRIIYDTARENNHLCKYDVLTFYDSFQEGASDTMKVVLLKFIDDSSYSFYKNQLRKISKRNSLTNSIAFEYDKLENKEMGFEYLINNGLIGGLTEELIQPIPNSNFTKKYRLYFYCIKGRNGALKDLSILFK